ncbi:DUF1934 domain-containing protein [Christensenellaceae bacterium OttesenSCG-928-K19]|nr:DUF1934 domain-containing protein [Christensenellaceae bacterium OttesenSCG-928-K19]
MDKHDVILNVRGSHVVGGEEDFSELITEGLLSRDEGKCIIEYEESELSGTENTLTCLIVEADKIRLRRTGESSTEFVFRRSQMYETAYDTPFGMIQMTVLPTQITSDISSDKSGSVDLEYVVKIGSYSAINRLNIGYKQKDFKS